MGHGQIQRRELEFVRMYNKVTDCNDLARTDNIQVGDIKSKYL